MLTSDEARAHALRLPETVEQDHHGRPSFRVGGHIFATLWTERAMNVMPGEEHIRWAVQEFGDRCRPVHWGRRLAAVQVDLDLADAPLLEDLLDLAWTYRAPPRLARASAALARFGLGRDDGAAWLASGLPEKAFDDWLTDRVARRPAGARARAVYGAEDVHDFARVAILDALALGPDDHLLEIGCGGGLLLRAALSGAATATGLDHSEDMVDLARRRAPGARVLIGAAEHLPLTDAQFTAIAMSVVFLFFPEPLAVLAESHRVLVPGGRLAVYTTAPELRGTPAAPEPVASRGHFHDDATLIALTRQAGFVDARVVNREGGQLLTANSPRPQEPFLGKGVLTTPG